MKEAQRLGSDVQAGTRLLIPAGQHVLVCSTDNKPRELLAQQRAYQPYLTSCPSFQLSQL